MNENNSLDNLLKEGHHLLERGQYEEGLQVFQQADSLFPDIAEVKYAIGLAHYRLEQYEQGVKYLNQALQLRQVYPLALVRRGIAYKALKQSDLANADFEAVLKIEPQSNDDWRARGIAFDELKRSEEALECYDNILEIEPINHQVWQNRGLTLQDLQRFDDALNCFDRALEILPDKFLTIRSRGRSLFLLKKYQEAIDNYNIALKLKPQDSFSLTSQGLNLFKLGKSEEAIANYDRALENQSNNTFALCFKGYALVRLGQYKTALSCYDRALEIDPKLKLAKTEKSLLLSLNKYQDHDSKVSQAYFDFLLEILRKIYSRVHQKQIILLLQQNTDKLNCNLVIALQTWVRSTLQNLQPEPKKDIGYYICKFSNIIESFSLGSRSDNLEIAIAGYNIASNILSLQEFPILWSVLGSTYIDRIKGERVENIEKAILASKKSLENLTRQDSPIVWAKTQYNIGNAYTERIKGDKAQNIEDAIFAYTEALEIRTKQNFPKDWAMIQNNLGLAYLERVKEERVKNIEKAIYSFEKALEILTQQNFPKDWAMIQDNLGSVYRERIKGKKTENLEKAISSFEKALEILTQQNFPKNWATVHNNLGLAYSDRIKGKKTENLEKAISSFEKALEILTQQNYPREWTITHNNLGTVYIQRKKGARAENLEKAISSQKKVLNIPTLQNLPREWIRTQNILGLTYSERIKGERAENLEKAVSSFEKALEICSLQNFPREWAATQNNLGDVYRIRIMGERAENLKRAISAYQQALIFDNLQTNPIQCRNTSRKLGNLYFKEDNWQQAIEAYSLAIEAIEKSRLSALNDERRQEIITESIEVYENIVQACINLGQVEKAIEYTERSRCRRLVDLMASNDLYSDGEIPPQVAQYLQEYDRLQQRINEERERPKDNGTKSGDLTGAGVRSSRASFEAANERIKQLEEEKQQVWQQIRAFDKVLSEQIQVEPIAFDAISELIPDRDTALISCYVTSSNLQIFVVFKDKPVIVHTTEFGRQQLTEFAINSWFKPYLRWLRKKEDPDYSPAWQLQMPQTLAELSQHLDLTELVEHHLQNVRELIIIPHLYLHSIPFTALPINSSGSEVLGERFRLRILPSAQILQFCHQRADIPIDSVGTVEDADNSLPFSQYEGEQIARIYQVPAEKRLRGKEQAKIANYRQLIEQVQVLHSSHHASSRLDNPLESQLQLADGTISLGEIMSPGWRVPNLTDVFLSCCETNLGFAQLSDDPLTLGTGFLCAGARSVVSTLWSVEDMATALFSIIYYELRNSSLDRSTALQQAQHRLKNLSGTEIAEHYYPQLYQYLTTQFKQAETNRKQTRQKLKQLNRGTSEHEQMETEKKQWSKVANKFKRSIQRLEHSIQQVQPFAHPYYWAGFISQGLR